MRKKNYIKVEILQDRFSGIGLLLLYNESQRQSNVNKKKVF